MQTTTKEKDSPKKELPLKLKRILALIPEDRTITANEIASIIGITTVEVRYSIRRLIISYHKPIGTFNTVSRGKGYKLIIDSEEQFYTVQNLRGRANEILARAKTIENMKL